MKKSILAVAILSLYSAQSFACGSTGCNSTPNNWNYEEANSIQNSLNPASTAVSNSFSHSTSNNSQQQQASSSSALANDSNNRVSTDVIALSFPSFTMAPLPASLCDKSDPKYREIGIGWNLIHLTKQDTNNLCAVKDLYNTYIEMCLYKEAHKVFASVTETIVEGYTADPTLIDNYKNLTPEQCAEKKALAKMKSESELKVVPAPKPKAKKIKLECKHLVCEK